MIAAFNRRQTARAVMATCLGLAATGFTFVFFYGVVEFVSEEFRLDSLAPWAPHIAGGALLIVFYTGWDLWSRGFGHTTFADSDFAQSFDRSTAGGTWTNIQLAEARVWGHLISQIALAAPLQFLKTWDLLRSRIPASARLESQLKELLATIQEKDRWHSIVEYQGRKQEVSYLIRMGHLDFSPRRGNLRPKS